MKVSLSIALKLSFFARLAKRACRSGDEVEVSFPRFGVRGYSESGLVPVRRPSWHTPPHTCLAEFSNYAELCTFEYAWSNAEEVRRIGLHMSGLLIVK